MEYVLGLDTSNYTTSLALVSREGETIADIRRMLNVKHGQRGLRQSEALFQHVNNLPELFENADLPEGRIAAIAASEKPRPVEGSYMPCFLPGMNFAKSLASVMQVPYFGTTHQEGHIQAILPETGFSRDEGFMAFHLSGGTCELLMVKDENIDIIGASKDISFGQVLDRIGVKLGMSFPAGKEMDDIAMRALEIKAPDLDFGKRDAMLPPLKISDASIHLSGLESAAMRMLDRNAPSEDVICSLFMTIAQGIIDMCIQGAEITSMNDIVLAGGVSSSRTVKKIIKEKSKIDKTLSKLNIIIPDGDLGRDNAVGVARLGAKRLWQLNP